MLFRKSAFVVPLLKGGDSTILDSYRPISKLCVLSKILESLISEQLTCYLNVNKVLSINQSGFRKKHSTTTAALKVLNDIVGSIDNGDFCASLFIDLSKAFDTVDHEILLHRLKSVGLSSDVIPWFKNYLSGRTQCVQAEGKLFDSLSEGVPQGSVLGPLLFTIYINCLDYDIQDANFHFYADDSVMYCSASSGKQALYKLQSAFDVIQSRIYNLKLVLNVDKTKYKLFSGSKKFDKNVSSLLTLQGTVIESVKDYKYLGIIVDDALSFSSHITQLKKK